MVLTRGCSCYCTARGNESDTERSTRPTHTRTYPHKPHVKVKASHKSPHLPRWIVSDYITDPLLFPLVSCSRGKLTHTHMRPALTKATPYLALNIRKSNFQLISLRKRSISWCDFGVSVHTHETWAFPSPEPYRAFAGVPFVVIKSDHIGPQDNAGLNAPEEMFEWGFPKPALGIVVVWSLFLFTSSSCILFNHRW